jgi:hypothetical protein
MHKIGLKFTLALVAGLLWVNGSAMAQRPFPLPPGTPRPPVRVAPAQTGDGELKLATAPNVNLKFCISDGRLRINGWDRNEVRVFVRNGRKFNLRVLEKNAAGQPNWVWIASDLQESVSRAPMSECLTGSDVEMDVPTGSTLNISGRSADTVIDSVRKASVKILEGNLALRNVDGGIEAAAYQGDITVENSAGAILIESTTGNLLAFDVSPGQIGDLFRAKTNSGAITMQKVAHRQIEANSITGSVLFDGSFLAGGIYGFQTSNGSIRVLIPERSSCNITAAYGWGSFNSEFPMKYSYRNETSRAKNLAGVIGTGESCNLNLTTNSGSINILRPGTSNGP